MANLSCMKRPPVDQRRVRRHFSGHAEEYERYAQVQKRVVAGLLERLAAVGSFSGPILEVGAGTGALARCVAEGYPHLPLVVTDLAHGMTRQAAARLPGASALDADAACLPFVAGAFGLMLSASMYQWIVDLPAAFSESARVLKPGGRFVFALFGARTLCELRSSHRQAQAEIDGGRPSHTQEFPSREEVAEALRSAGFVEIAVESVDEREHHPDVPELLRALKKIGAQNASRSGPAGLASRRVMERMMELYRREHGREGMIPATYEVLYGAARRP